MQLFVIRATDIPFDLNERNIISQIDDMVDDQLISSHQFTDSQNMLQYIQQILLHHTPAENETHENEMHDNETRIISACNIWDNIDYLYVGYYVDSTDNKDMRNQINVFASHISHQSVVSDMVIVKNKLSYMITGFNIAALSSEITMTDSDLKYICSKIFIKNGVVIPVSGEMTLYDYMTNPLEHLMKTDAKYAEHYVYHEYETYTQVMMIIACTREMNGTINERASLLAGYPVNGTVFVAFFKKPDFNENPPYLSTTIERVQNIQTIRSKSVTFTEGMQKSANDYVNFDKLLELEIQRHAKVRCRGVTEITGKLLNDSSR